MSSGRLRYSVNAAFARHEIADYFREQSGEPLARRWLREVFETTRNLRDFPERGIELASSLPAITGVRRILVSGFPNYLIFYRYSHTDKSLLIMDIVHGAKDLESVLRDQED